MHESDDLNIQLDRLVDGELSAEQREQFLITLEQQDGWRDCALAFLENQSWRREMKSLVGLSPTDAAVPHKTLPPRNAEKSGSRALGSMALAAGLLIAFSLGWLTRPGDAPVEIDQQLAGGKVELEAPPELPQAIPGLDDHDVVTLLVRDDQGQENRLRVPLVEWNGNDQQNNTTVGALPDGLMRKLQRRGMDLRGRRRYAPFYIEQNEQVVPMAVPVDDAYIVPVSRPVL